MEREMFAIEEEPTGSKQRRSPRREVLGGSLPTGSRDRRAGVGARKTSNCWIGSGLRVETCWTYVFNISF
jgi:hypothetical protein